MTTGTPIESAPALLRLFHLVSPALPVGAYAYSQGMEYAVHAGWIADEASTFEWLEQLTRHAIGRLDLPLLYRLHRAWSRCDVADVRRWNSELMASRETSEARAEERHLGRSLARVLLELEVAPAAVQTIRDPTFAAQFALAATQWGIDETATAFGYLWSWTENQVLAALKLAPLGQSAGLRLLHRLTDAMKVIVAQARVMEDAELGVGVIAPIMASAWHETQYSRLFRS